MTTFSRIRLDMTEAELLFTVLKEAEYKRVGAKIKARDEGDEAALSWLRWELSTLSRLTDETRRCMNDLGGRDASEG